MANLTRKTVTDMKEAYRVYRPEVLWQQLQVAHSFRLNPYHFREFLHDNHLDIWKLLQGTPSDDVMTAGQIFLDEWFATELINGNDGQSVLNQYFAG